MNLLNRCALLLCLIGLAGCGTTVNLTVKRMPELNLGSVKNIKVETFSIRGAVIMDPPKYNYDYWRSVLASGVGKDGTMWLFKFYGDDNYRQDLKNTLARDGYFQVVSDAGVADARIDGHVDYTIRDNIQENPRNKKSPFSLTRQILVNAYFQVYGQRSVVIGNPTVTAAAENTWDGTSEDDVRKQAKKSNVEVMVQNAIAEVPPLLLKKIAPYYVTESRTLEDGDSDLIKKANKAAASDKWEEATSIWIERARNGNEMERAAAIYNLAVYDEISHRLDDALKRLQDLYTSTKKQKYSDEVSRIKARINEELQLTQIEALRGNEQLR